MACYNIFELGINLNHDESSALAFKDEHHHHHLQIATAGPAVDTSSDAVVAAAAAAAAAASSSYDLSYYTDDMLMPLERRVVQWHPQQGTADNTLSVTLEQKMARVPRMKLMFGMVVVETMQQHQLVPSLDDDEPRVWINLCARVPPATSLQIDVGQVPLSIVVYNDERIDQWAFGTFTYILKESTPTSLADNYQLLQLLAPYSTNELQPNTPTTPTSSNSSSTTNTTTTTTTSYMACANTAVSNNSCSSSAAPSATANYYYTTQNFAGVLNKAHLKICGDLSDMTLNWTAQEWSVGRRLVQFTRKADGETSDGHSQIACSFQPMNQQEHQQQRMRENMAAAAAAAAVAAAAAAAAGGSGQQQNHHHHNLLRHHHQGISSSNNSSQHNTATSSLSPPSSSSSSSSSPNTTLVVSCIYWRDRNDYYITSVDCIYLLEGLIGVQFTVEEKNRIRRNLEGFRPLTVSKCKPDCAEFFKLIMGFPHPKPRNIEKDVKVFAWKTLPHALRKIIRKYTPSYSSTAGVQRHNQHGHHYTHQPPSGLRYI